MHIRFIESGVEPVNTEEGTLKTDRAQTQHLRKWERISKNLNSKSSDDHDGLRKHCKEVCLAMYQFSEHKRICRYAFSFSGPLVDKLPESLLHNIFSFLHGGKSY